MSGSEKPDLSRRQGSRRGPWKARVASDATPTRAAENRKGFESLAELAERAGRAAQASARRANLAARSASLAAHVARRLDQQPLEESRRLVTESDGAARDASDAAVKAENEASLAQLAIRSDLEPLSRD